MSKRILVPGQVDCIYEKMCKKREVRFCLNCNNNRKLDNAMKNSDFYKAKK